MTVYVCETCAAHYEAGAGPPEACLICRDDRQYVGTGGDGMQRWITQEELFRSGHRNVITPVKHGVFTIGMHPQLGIGQVAHLLQRPSGNVLWDCVCLAPASVPDIRRLGGVHKVVISHPHFYTACCFWAETFGCAVFVHARDRAFVTQPCPAIRVWADDALRVGPGLTAHRLGGHFPGSCVMLDEGDGTLYSGDTVMPTPGGASFMYSYPNLLPLPAGEVRRIAARLGQLDFEQVRGAFEGKVIPRDAKRRVLTSAALYVSILEGSAGKQHF